MTAQPEQNVALKPGDGVRFLADQLERGGNPNDQVTITRGTLVHLYRELERLYPIEFRATAKSVVPSMRYDSVRKVARYILGEDQP